MKKMFLTLALCIFAGAIFAQENSIFPKEGKVMEYTADAKSPMGDQKMEIKQYIKAKDGDKVTVTTEMAGNKIDITYTIVGDKVTASFQDMMSSALSQLGKFELLESTGDFYYPLNLEANKEFPGVKMKIKANVQGMDLTFDITMDNRRAEGEESVTVPAGTFKCIKVVEENVVQVMGQDQLSEITTWYAPGVGLVKQYTNSMNGMVTNTMELTKISSK